MPRLTIDDLKKLREQAAGTITLRSGAARARVTIHMGTCGIAAGAREVMAALLKEIEAQGVTDVIVTTSGCAGLCSREPMATVELRSQAPVKYVNLTPDGMVRVFRAHVLGGEVVTESALAAGCETTG
ncbi:MAG TPA: (2Fe-2S) ferredoxin domain-containing protein [Vicinamibacterales bacterium]|nr:(2Fe-2S) ferredoxin domain-containing protein [Vicinamibacterales bacterium]